MAISHIPIEDQDKTIEAYCNATENGYWKWDELSTFLSPDSLKVIASHYTLPLCEWIMDNLSTSNANNDSKGQMMFVITLWWLWKWRNTKIFGRDEEKPIDPIQFLHIKLKEMSDLLVGLLHQMMVG
uniref:LURP1-like domain-containing protein n=1 Tax=Tanacetum cinerariifolium TaxID=118510 RepID=A0A6L2MU77_TANCI|nr:LURP1-like domain-containing protein [Tanacetum cinerariifolium]